MLFEYNIFLINLSFLLINIKHQSIYLLNCDDNDTDHYYFKLQTEFTQDEINTINELIL